MAQQHDPHTAWLMTLTEAQLEKEIVNARGCLETAIHIGKAFDISRLQSNLGSAGQVLAFRKRARGEG